MTPEQTAIVAKRTIEGVPVRTIADEIGCTHPTVVRTRQKPDVRALVEEGITKLIKRGLNPSVNTLCRFAALGNNKAITADKDLAKMAISASNSILGHIQGGGPQTVVNQLIYQQSAHAPIDPSSMAMVERAMGMADQDDVIDVLPVDRSVDK